MAAELLKDVHLNRRHLIRSHHLVLIDVGVHLLSGGAVEMTLLVERIADTLNHAAVDLALDQLRVNGPATVVDSDDTLDLDDARFRVDRQCRVG